MPDPLVGDFNIAGLNFQWGAEGIFGITLSPIGLDGYRTVYFSPLSSHTEFSVSTRILRDENKVKGSYKDFNVVGARGSDGHTTAKVMDDTGVQLFNLIDQNAIGCWSSALPYKPQNIGIADKDDVGFVFPSDIKIDDQRNVWMLSDRMPVFLEAELDYSDINFRIYTVQLNSLLEGTVCERPNRQYSLGAINLHRSPVHYTSKVYTESPLARNLPVSPFLQINQNVIPRVNSFTNIDFPKQQAVPYLTRRFKNPSNRWLYNPYEVYE